MQANQKFLNQIAMLRRRIINRELKRLALNTLFLSTILIAFSLAIQKFEIFKWSGNSIYLFLVLIAFAFSLLALLRSKRSFMDELIEIDKRLGLKDRLSTAYEYHQLKRKSIFTDLLVEEAASFISMIKPEPIITKKLARKYMLTPLFVAVIMALLFVDFTSSIPPQEKVTREALEQVSEKMEQYSKKEKQRAKKPRGKSADDIYRRMEELARELKTKRMNREKLLQSLGDLRKELDTEQQKRARKLKAELSMGDVSNTPALEKSRKEKVTPREVEALKKQIKEAFDQEIPVSLSEDLASLDRGHRLEKFLDETMKEVMAALPDENDTLSPGEKKGAVMAQFSEERDQQVTKQSRDQSAPGTKEGQSKKPVSPTAGKGESDSDATQKEKRTSDDDQAYISGRGKDDGQKKMPYDLKSSKSPALKDKGVLGPGERYNVHVRSLPAIAKAKLKGEEVFKTYQKELEEVLQKEDIPLNYREYIKNYFLSIGLRKEENGKRDTY
ncbi:MAG: hypothetical protein JRI34_08590 [Deltaproteobacteria bacterium]|nr:hypothetical protein [Deltaproteobacteria bacterium]